MKIFPQFSGWKIPKIFEKCHHLGVSFYHPFSFNDDYFNPITFKWPRIHDSFLPDGNWKDLGGVLQLVKKTTEIIMSQVKSIKANHTFEKTCNEDDLPWFSVLFHLDHQKNPWARSSAPCSVTMAEQRDSHPFLADCWERKWKKIKIKRKKNGCEKLYEWGYTNPTWTYLNCGFGFLEKLWNFPKIRARYCITLDPPKKIWSSCETKQHLATWEISRNEKIKGTVWLQILRSPHWS